MSEFSVFIECIPEVAVMEDLVQTLTGICTDAGYPFDVEDTAVTTDPQRLNDVLMGSSGQDPFILLMLEPQRTRRSAGDHWTIETMTVTAHLGSTITPLDMASWIARPAILSAAVRHAVLQDPTRGGVALDTRVGEYQSWAGPTHRCVISLPIQVVTRYRRA